MSIWNKQVFFLNRAERLIIFCPLQTQVTRDIFAHNGQTQRPNGNPDDNIVIVHQRLSYIGLLFCT